MVAPFDRHAQFFLQRVGPWLDEAEPYRLSTNLHGKQAKTGSVVVQGLYSETSSQACKHLVVTSRVTLRSLIHHQS